MYGRLHDRRAGGWCAMTSYSGRSQYLEVCPRLLFRTPRKHISMLKNLVDVEAAEQCWASDCRVLWGREVRMVAFNFKFYIRFVHDVIEWETFLIEIVRVVCAGHVLRGSWKNYIALTGQSSLLLTPSHHTAYYYSLNELKTKISADSYCCAFAPKILGKFPKKL